MGVLQDPVSALSQARWYLENSALEKFPGAFELAAGNICRQTLEQILFILCFFSSMPKSKYMKQDRQLKTAWQLYDQLKKIEPNLNKKYIEIARSKSERIRKFARNPRTLDKWRKVLNESSHFSAKHRKLNNTTLFQFIEYAESLFDQKDKYLIISALNELFSNGRFQATIGKDITCTPGILVPTIIDIKNIERTVEGKIALNGPQRKLHVISSTEIPRGRWPNTPVMVQHSEGISIGVQFIKKDGTPINISSMKTMLDSFSTTPDETKRLVRRLKKIGFNVEHVQSETKK